MTTRLDVLDAAFVVVVFTVIVELFIGGVIVGFVLLFYMLNICVIGIIVDVFVWDDFVFFMSDVIDSRLRFVVVVVADMGVKMCFCVGSVVVVDVSLFVSVLCLIVGCVVMMILGMVFFGVFVLFGLKFGASTACAREIKFVICVVCFVMSGVLL